MRYSTVISDTQDSTHTQHHSNDSTLTPEERGKRKRKMRRKRKWMRRMRRKRRSKRNRRRKRDGTDKKEVE